MLLSSLTNVHVKHDFEIQHLTDDSRLVQAGSVFICLEDAGDKQKEYIQKALDAGAAAVITALSFDGERVITVPSPALCLVKYAKFKFPKQPKVVVGVTGTNGKTSVAWFYNSLMNSLGIKAACVGTLGVYVGGELRQETGYTSPTALKLHEILHGLAEEGVQAVCLEVSSHALALHRVDGVNFTAAAFTNLTPDHRDFHGSMEAYAAAKGRLFAEVLPENASAVVNVQKPEGWPYAAMVKQRGLQLLSAGTANAELVVKVVENKADGIVLNVKYEKTDFTETVPLVGAFQAENLAIALGLVLQSDVKESKLQKAFSALTSAPGRMEVYSKEGTASVVVDYAHTPDALATALKAIRPQVKGKLWVIFGCGGNRDAAKRPQMGGIAQELSDYPIITDDNPRFENADAIRAQIQAACPQAKNIASRAEAIEYALNNASENDIILVAGKGHETGQYVNGTVVAYNERQTVQELLKK